MEETKTTKNKTDKLDPVSMTPEERAIFQRVQAEDTAWPTITEEMMHDYSLATMETDLRVHFPEAWKEQVEKRFAFRWCERDPKRVDELTRGGNPITQWKICTRTTTPFLEKYVDSVLGCIARLDQMLLFRPWERHMIEKRAKEGRAGAIAERGKPENIAMRRAQEGVEAYSGEQFKINSGDIVDYEDSRDDIGDVVVES